MSAGWDYVAGTWCECARCRTVRPKTAMRWDDSDPVGLSYLVCRDVEWCEREKKRKADLMRPLE